MRYLSSPVLLILLASIAAAAGPFDHLRCDKIRDTAPRASFTVDLGSGDPSFPSQTGCVVRVPAKTLCVDVSKGNVTPTPPGAPDGPQASRYLCYKVKCPKARPVLNLTDQFGQHRVIVQRSNVLCAPVAPSPTTTITSTSSTTTTTLPATCCDGSGCYCTAAVCPPVRCTISSVDDGACTTPGTCRPACQSTAECAPGLFCFFPATSPTGICVGCAGNPAVCPAGTFCQDNDCVQLQHPECQLIIGQTAPCIP